MKERVHERRERKTMNDYSITATIKDYEERLESVQRQFVRVRMTLQGVIDTHRSKKLREELYEVANLLRAQMGEISDIIACLREDRAEQDEKGA